MSPDGKFRQKFQIFLKSKEAYYQNTVMKTKSSVLRNARAVK